MIIENADSYTTRGFRVLPSSGKKGRHWQGGPNDYQGATCPKCKRPLVLIWDFDCKDSKMKTWGESSFFGGRSRMPLFYCFKCIGVLSYRLTADNKVSVLRNYQTGVDDFQKELAGVVSYDFPYEPFPNQFELMPIQIEEIPREIERLQALRFILTRFDQFARLNDRHKDNALLSKWYGRKIDDLPNNMELHQLGGIPYRLQGRVHRPCPQKSCSSHKKEEPMDFLATIPDAPWRGLPLYEAKSEKNRNRDCSFRQLVFSICRRCCTVEVQGECG